MYRNWNDNWSDDVRARMIRRDEGEAYAESADRDAYAIQARTDFLGQVYGVGDLVIYGASGGRSINMVIAKVVGFTEAGTVQLRPVKASRWTQHNGKNYYADNRTGKRIDPWRGDNHVAEKGHSVCKKTRHKLDEQDCADDGCTTRYPGFSARRSYHGYGDKDYVPTKFQPWVEERHEETKMVTISIVENIVKWTGPVDD